MAVLIHGFSKLDSVHIGAPSAIVPPPPEPTIPVYTFDGADYRQIITDPTPVANKRLGAAVGVSDDGQTITGGTLGLGVLVYSFDGTSYGYTATITNPGVSGFGCQSTLSGDGLTLFVGSNNTRIYVYKRTAATDTAWTRTDTIVGSGTFGRTAISANYDGTRFITQEGTAIRAYANVGSWYRAETRTNTNAQGGSSRLSSDGTYYCVNTNSGAKVFEFGGNEIANFVRTDATGAAISGDGLTVSVTTYGSGPSSGTFIYSRPDTTSAFTAYARNPIPSNIVAINGFSDSLSEDGTILTFSSDNEVARIYEENEGIYTMQRNLNEPNQSFGISSKLARSGAVFVVGAETGFGGASYAGQLYAYRAVIKV